MLYLNKFNIFFNKINSKQLFRKPKLGVTFFIFLIGKSLIYRVSIPKINYFLLLLDENHISIHSGSCADISILFSFFFFVIENFTFIDIVVVLFMYLFTNN